MRPEILIFWFGLINELDFHLSERRPQKFNQEQLAHEGLWAKSGLGENNNLKMNICNWSNNNEY